MPKTGDEFVESKQDTGIGIRLAYPSRDFGVGDFIYRGLETVEKLGRQGSALFFRKFCGFGNDLFQFHVIIVN